MRSYQNLIPIHELGSNNGCYATQPILGIHGMPGCYTISSLFGIGEGRAWQRLTKSKELLHLSCIINDANVTHNVIFEAGLKMVALLYGRKSSESLNHLKGNLKN